MKFSPKANKIIGIIGVLFGLGIFTLLFLAAHTKLIIAEADFFPLRYFKVILCIIGGSYFITLGVLTYTAFLSPYFSANRWGKAKLNVFNGISSIPFFSLLIIAMFSLTKGSRLEGSWLIILWSALAVLIMFFAWGFFSGINILRERGLSKKSI